MDYAKALQEAHKIEVGGEALYAAVARRTRDPQRRDKWLALQKLETQTQSRVARAAAAIGVSVEPHKADVRLGNVVGGVLSWLPWRLQMRMLRAVAGKYVHTWERMQRECTDGDPKVLAELVAHEVAQVDFARDELEGRGASSLGNLRKSIYT